MNRDIENLQKILLEMPQRMLPIEHNSYDDYRDNIELLLARTSSFLKNPNIEIRRASTQTGDIVLFFIKGGVLSSAYSYKQLVNHIKTTSSWNNPDCKNSFYAAFINYILPTFKVVESDDKLTDLGYDFWVRLMRSQPNLFFYVKDKSGISRIENSDELQKYFGDDEGYQDYNFVASITKL